jgi:hypothetical protein
MKWLIGLLGVFLLAFGGWAAVDPASFPAKEFPPLNEHLTHDLAAVFLAFGLGLVVAAWLVPSWRTPVLAVTAAWSAFHAISHVADLDRATTQAAGVSALIQTTALAVLFALLAWRSAKSD